MVMFHICREAEVTDRGHVRFSMKDRAELVSADSGLQRYNRGPRGLRFRSVGCRILLCLPWKLD